MFEKNEQLVDVTIGQRKLRGRLETRNAPVTCDAFRALLPLEKKLLHARWSGEAAWAPLQTEPSQIPPENVTCYPAPGQLLFYPGGLSEPEILVPYGSCAFASKAGALAGNHFLTITEGLDWLAVIGRELLHQGAQPITFNLPR